MKILLKKVLRLITQEYQLNRIYYIDLPADRIEAGLDLPRGTVVNLITSPSAVMRAADERMRDHAWYAGEDAIGYGIWEDGELVCMSWFWTARHTKLPKRFADVTFQEAVMVDLLTTPRCRGRGYARAIARYAAIDLASRGYRRLWTWVWHSNRPSISVFQKAGWRYHCFLVEFRFVGVRRDVRFKLPPLGT